MYDAVGRMGFRMRIFESSGEEGGKIKRLGRR
jgi:hypothetical protein